MVSGVVCAHQYIICAVVRSHQFIVRVVVCVLHYIVYVVVPSPSVNSLCSYPLTSSVCPVKYVPISRQLVLLSKDFADVFGHKSSGCAAVPLPVSISHQFVFTVARYH